MGSALKNISNFVLPKLGAVGGFTNGLVQGEGFGDSLQSGLKSGLDAALSIGGSIVGGPLGSFAGNSLADSLMPNKQKSDAPAGPTPDAPFSASRAPQLTAPGSLGGLDDQQQSSNLATQGVYGGGNGPDEQAYFQNLINRKLVDDSGNVDQTTDDVSPIEMSYLKQLGLGGSGTSTSILEALSKWKPQGQAA